jgi:hypothetical protein
VGDPERVRLSTRRARRTAGRRRAALLLLAPLLAGCPTARAYRPFTPVVLSASDSVLGTGDTLGLALAVENPTDVPITLRFEPGCPVRFVVSSLIAAEPDATRPARVVVCGDAAREIELGAGAARTSRARWPALEAGEYQVHAVLGQHHVLRGTERQLQMGRRSAEIKIRVMPRVQEARVPHGTPAKPPPE